MSNKGLIFVRKIGSKTLLVGIFDTDAVPDLQAEHQHLTIIQQPTEGFTSLAILHDRAIDRTEEAAGMGISGIVCSPIWQN